MWLLRLKILILLLEEEIDFRLWFLYNCLLRNKSLFWYLVRFLLMVIFLVFGLFLNFFEFLMRWNLRLIDFSLVIICFGCVWFWFGLFIWCDIIIFFFCRGILIVEIVFRILLLVFLLVVFGILVIWIKGFWLYCLSLLIFWKRFLFCFFKMLIFFFSGWVVLWILVFMMFWIWVLIVVSLVFSKDFIVIVMCCMLLLYIVNGFVIINVGVLFFLVLLYFGVDVCEGIVGGWLEIELFLDFFGVWIILLNDFDILIESFLKFFLFEFLLYILIKNIRYYFKWYIFGILMKYSRV